MSGSEHLQDVSGDANRRERDMETDNQHREPLHFMPDGIASREPFGDNELFVNESREDAHNVDGDLSVDDVVNNIIMHDHMPIENLPVMVAPELKLIGRCVSLSVRGAFSDADQLFYYTGLVFSVNVATVTLTHVNRYTPTDYRKFIARERRVTKDGRRVETGPCKPVTRASGLSFYGYTAVGELGVGRDGALVSTPDTAALLRLDAAGSLAPATHLCTAADFDAQASASIPSHHDVGETAPTITGALRTKRFCGSDASIGPLPFVSFQRKRIHDVRFGRDPRSSFYSLFEDPSKKLMDMQYLRMFVRRYLVHTSEGNNPRQVPLYAFVTVRGACPNVDRELVNQIAREELPGLMKVDRAIEKDKKRQKSRANRQHQAMQAYAAPSGIFSGVGILYSSCVPQVTFVTTIVIFLFVVAFVVFLSVSLGVLKDPLIVAYEWRLLGYFLPSALVWAVAGVFTLLHSLYARVPLRSSMASMIVRAISSFGAIACSVMVIVAVTVQLTDRKLYEFMKTASEDQLCQFYNKYRCSGFTTTCRGNTDLMCQSRCAQAAGNNYSEVCSPYLWNRVLFQLIPLLVLAAFLLCLFIYSIFLLWRLWSAANHVRARAH